MQTSLKGLDSSREMAVELNHPVSRRAAILKIIRESPVHSQDDLVRALKKQGFEATQSSVSRDLRELKVAKAGDRYLLPADEDAAQSSPFDAILSFVLEIRTAGPSLTVVRTMTGTAQSVAVAIDKAHWPEVVGTISGDDTIFLATEDVRAQRQLSERLRSIFRI
jgi:transcriptional regulator of arginine metabolism